MSGQVLENSSNIVSTPCGQCVSFFYDLRYIEIFEIICYQFFNCEIVEKRVLWRRRNNLEIDFYFDRDMTQKKFKTLSIFSYVSKLWSNERNVQFYF